MKRVMVKIGPLERSGARDSLGLFTVYVDELQLESLLAKAVTNRSGKSVCGPFTALYKQMPTAKAEYLEQHPELLK